MVKVYAEKDGDRYTLECKGHATGSEAVCAGVSAIVYALAGWAEQYAEREVKVELDSGEGLVTFRGGSEAEAAFDVAVIGLRQLEPDYGAYISVDCETL